MALDDIKPNSQFGLIRYEGQGDVFPRHPILDAPDEELPPQHTEKDPELIKLYKKLQGRVKRLKEAWCSDIEETNRRRDIRHVNIDCEQWRKDGKLNPDETIVPSRVANDNITKEQAPFISYMTTSRNIAIFKPKDDDLLEQGFNSECIEHWFTKVFRYDGWEIPQYQTVDGSQTHGCDYVEVIVDKTKPGFFAVEHIARENCWFPTDIENIQDAHTLVRNTRVSEYRLRRFKDVDMEQVNKIFDHNDTEGENPKDSTDSLADVQKVFYRKGDIVYVCWLSVDKGDYFVREPKPLFHGGKEFVMDPMTGQPINSNDVYETSYPVVPLPYIISENGKLKEIKGRVFFDEYLQEGVTAVISSIVNSWLRAAEVYGAPANPTPLANDGASVLQTANPIIGGKWVNTPVTFFSKPYPDSSGMNIVQSLLAMNKQESGSQINYAALNREDSRKTAREVSAAMQQAAVLSSVQVTLFSIYMRSILNRCWKISSNYVKTGELKVSKKTLYYFQYEYEIASAGDTEVIQREETLNRLIQVYPALAPYPMVAMAVMEDILTLSFPKQGQKYVTALRQGNQMQMMMEGMKQLLQQIVTENPEIMQRLSPEDQQGLQFIISGGGEQQQQKQELSQKGATETMKAAS